MAIKEHDCIQEHRLERLENKTDNLDTKYDKIMELLADNKVKLAEILTRLDKKKEGDKKKEDQIEEEEKRMDTLETKQSTLEGQFGLILKVLIAIIIIGVGYLVEFNIKTLIFHM